MDFHPREREFASYQLELWRAGANELKIYYRLPVTEDI